MLKNTSARLPMVTFDKAVQTDSFSDPDEPIDWQTPELSPNSSVTDAPVPKSNDDDNDDSLDKPPICKQPSDKAVTPKDPAVEPIS